MANIKNTSDITRLLSEYQSGQTQNAGTENIDIPKFEDKQTPMLDIVGMINAGPEPLVEYNNENKFLEAAMSGYGQSHLDKRFGYQSDEDLEELRANEQAWIGKVANGLVKGGITAATTAVNSTLGLAYGLLRSPFGNGEGEGGIQDGIKGMIRSGVNNEVSQFTNKVQTKAEEWFPNYRTEEERTDEYQRQFLRPSHFFSGNFLGDSILKNFGFTVGAMGGGMLWNKVFGKIFANKLSSDLMKGVVSASEGNSAANKKIAEAAEIIKKSGGINNVDQSTLEIIMKNIKDAGKTIKTANLTTQLLGAATAAMGEGTAEGLMAKNEFLESFIPKMNQDFAEAYNSIEQSLYKEHSEWFATEDINGLPLHNPVLVDEKGKQELYKRQLDLSEKFKKTQEYAETQGDVLAQTTFLLNLPILMTSDLIQFGRMFGGDWTTARRNAPKVKGTFGNYTAAIKNPVLNATFGSSKVGATEAMEEMLQGFVSSGAQNIADTKLTYFKELGYDREAVEEAMNGVGLLFQGGKDYLGDTKNWQEGVIGALTGLFGMPGKKWGSGVVGEINRVKSEREASQKAADELNRLVNSDTFKNNWNGYIRHMAYDNEMRKAVENNDSYAWHTAEANQLISDVLTFANAGRLDDLKDFVDSVADIDVQNKDVIEDIRNFLRSTNEKENLELAKTPDDKIIANVKKQAESMKNTIQDYYEVFSDLADVAPEDIDTDRFKELMFTSMQLRRFEDDFSELLDSTIDRLTPYLSIKSAITEDGGEDTNLDNIANRFKELQSKYRQALSGNVRGNRILDYLTKDATDAMLDSAEEEIKKLKEHTTGNAAIQLKDALDGLQRMRKVADSRRELIQKLSSLRNMTSKAYDDKVREEQKKEQKKEEVAQLKQTSNKLNSVKDVNIELLKRQEGAERDEYYESLKGLRETNPAVDEFFKIEEIGADMSKVAGKKFNELGISPTEAMAASFILQYMGDNAETAEELLGLSPNLIPSLEDVVASFDGKSTVRGLNPNNPMHKMTLESIYKGGLNAAKEVINEINKARGLTKNMKSTQTTKAESVPASTPSPQPTTSTPEPEPTVRRGAKKEAEKKKKETEKKKAEKETKKRKKKELEQALSETPDTTPDPPTPASTVPISSTPLSSGTEPKSILNDESKEEPVVMTQEASVVSEHSTQEDVDEEARRNNEGAIKTDALEETVESGSESGERQNYNMSVPEMSPKSTRRRQSRISSETTYYPTLPEEISSYTEVWNLLNDKYNAFNNADLVRPGDKVYFFIDPSILEYDGEPQILMGIKRNGETKIYNILRKNVYADNKFSSWRGLKELREEILSEYRNWSPTEANPMFEFSKASKVWARRAGFMQYAESITEDKPIHTKKGFRKDAVIFTIDRDGNFVQLSGNKVESVEALLPKGFKNDISKNLQKDYGKPVIGNVYYLANGEDNTFLPIRLNVEHFTNDNKGQEGYGFDNIREAADKLAELSKEFDKEVKVAMSAVENNAYASEEARKTALSTAIDEVSNKYNTKKSEVVSTLVDFLDLHGVIITFGVLGQKLDAGVYVPTLRLAVYEEKRDESGELVLGEIDKKLRDETFANQVESSGITDWLASLGRSFNIRFPNSSEGSSEKIEKHVSSMAQTGLLTSNSVTMRPQGIDIYIDSFNPKTKQFDKGGRADYTPQSPSGTDSVEAENSVVTDTDTSAKPADVETKEVETEEQDEITEDTNLTYEALTDKQKEGLAQQGVSEDRFNSMTEDEQKDTIHCFI